MTQIPMKEDKPKRLLIDMPSELHAKIKSIAALHNITLRKLILRLIIIEIKKQEEYN